MFLTPDELDKEQARQDAINQAKQDIATRLTPEFSANIAKAVAGSYATNPEVTASLALSGLPIDFQAVHRNSQSQLRKNAQMIDNHEQLWSDTPYIPKPQDANLVTLLRMDPNDWLVPPHKQPDWWDKVDPGGQWRNLVVPEVTNARDLMNWTEPQVAKLFLSMPLEKWHQIPGMMEGTGGEYGTAFDSNGRKPGTFFPQQDLPAKFPILKQLWQGEVPAETGGITTALQGAIAEASQVMQTAQHVAGLPFKLLGFLTPDHIGPSGGINLGIVRVPSRISIEGIGGAARGVARGASTVMTGAAQFTKAAFEYAATHNTSSTLMVGAPSVNTQDFYNTVVRGNVVSEALSKLMSGQKVDLGTGFFPGGKVMEEAIRRHDLGLPKIDGQTWTTGRAVIQPLIKEKYIDKNGFLASAISGVVDAAVTVGTDPNIYFNPVESLMKTFNLSEVGATKLLNSRAADAVREMWSKDRQLAGLSTNIDNALSMVWDDAEKVWKYSPAESHTIPPFAGILPPGSTLPADAEAEAMRIARQTVEGKNLASLDNPPIPEPYLGPNGSRTKVKDSLGLLADDGSGIMRPNPMAIDQMPLTRDGQRALQKLGSFDNAGALYDAFNGNIPLGTAVAIQNVVDAARKIGDTPNINQIHKILVEGAMSGDPLYNISKVPGVVSQVINETGKTAAYWGARAGWRVLGSMPNSVFFSFEDPISSINDMNRLMVLMRVEPSARYRMLDSAMRAIVDGNSAKKFDLANEWMSTIVRPRLESAGVDKEWIDQVTRWSKWNDGVHKLQVDALGNDYPLPWLIDGSSDILKSVDALNHGFMMIGEQDQLDAVLKAVSRTSKVLAPLKNSDNPTIRNLFKDKGVAHWLTQMQSRWMKPVAMGAPLPIRMVTRILPDEGARIVVTGKMSPEAVMMLAVGGHVNYDTYGVMIRSGKELQKIVPQLEHLEQDLYPLLRRAEMLGDEKLIAKTLKRINKIESEYGTIDELKAQRDLYNSRIDTAIPGANRNLVNKFNGLMALQTNEDERIARYVRSRFGVTVDKTTNPREWVSATAEDLVKMNAEPIFREVAKAVLTGDKEEIANLVPRLLNGDLKDVLRDYRAAIAREDPSFALNRPDTVASLVGTILDNILIRTGRDNLALGAIATGKIGDFAISANHPYDLNRASSEMISWVRDNLLNNPLSAQKTLHFAKEYGRSSEQQVGWFYRMMTKQFSLYRNASEKFARTPYRAYQKWKKIIELIPVMDPTEARKMAEAIDKTDAPSWLKDGIREMVDEAKGTVTRRQAELLGEMHAVREEDKLLYNLNDKSYFGHRMALGFAFFDAWKEQWAVWTRAMAMDPTILEKARLAKEGAQNAEVPSWAGGEPGRGFLFKDPDTGQEVWAIPFSRQFFHALGLNAEEQISTKNMSLLGQGIPGVFGIGSMIIQSTIPTTSHFMGLNNLLFPYGRQMPKNRLADYFVAPWLQQMVGGATGLLAKQYPGLAKSGPLPFLQSMFNTDQSLAVQGGTVNAVLSNYVANLKAVPTTEEERKKILDDAYSKAQFVSLFKGFNRIFMPATSITKYYVESGAQNVTSGIVMDDFRKFQNESKDFGEAVSKLLDKYGNGAWIYLSGSTVSYDGMVPSKEYGQWMQKYGSLLDKYPLVAGYLGPQDGKFDPTAFAEQRTSGYRKPKDITLRQDKALSNLASAIYYQQQDKLIRLGSQQGLTEQQVRKSATFKQIMGNTANRLADLYPMWNRAAAAGEHDRTMDNQIRQIELMVKDKKVLAQPAGEALKQYWDYRTAKLTKLSSEYPQFGGRKWQTASATAPLREKLRVKGEALVQQYPEFKALWQNVLSQEFLPAEMGQ